ncbi:RluA family pseudouridine synthase [Tannockella kyphosi]|uniref:RluA family pseudouridine synthase n=1 Tax=Tannockella kyphosi TaxID=2899121 RepID=UPI0020133B45|nr:RluA family pseudouridine synthase [Tannockella kyphosi]
MITIVSKHLEGISLKEYLYSMEISRKALKDIKSKGDILVNGLHQTVRYLVKEGDRIEVIFPKEQHTMSFYPMDLTICYEDDHYLIIYKPTNLPCIPTKRYPHHTLANALVSYYHQNNIQATAHFVNRLDKDTQGLLLVSKTRQGHALLSKDIKQVKRVYYCMVEGILEGTGIIDTKIIKKEDSYQRIVSSHGKQAITHYQVIKQYKDKTLVECVLETGRTHQIRVHMAHIGHPLCFDTIYGASQEGTYYLESIYIQFIHPFTNQVVCIDNRKVI